MLAQQLLASLPAKTEETRYTRGSCALELTKMLPQQALCRVTSNKHVRQRTARLRFDNEPRMCGLWPNDSIIQQ